MPIQNTANCVLIRYDNGHIYVDRADGHSRKETYVELKGVKNEDHAVQIGVEYLSLLRTQRATTAIAGTVLTLPQIAGAAYRLGDNLVTLITIPGCVLNGTTTVTCPTGPFYQSFSGLTVVGTDIAPGTTVTHYTDPNTITLSTRTTGSTTTTLTFRGIPLPIQAMAASVDGVGNVKVVPQFGDPVSLQLDAMNRRIARMGAGIQSEWAAPAVNTQVQGTGTDTTPPAFSQSGQVVTQLSSPWAVPKPWWCSFVEADLTTAGTGTTRIRLYRELPSGSAVIVGTLLINAGDRKAVLPVPNPADPITAPPRGIGYPAKSKLLLACDMAGTGAAGLTVTARGIMV